MQSFFLFFLFLAHCLRKPYKNAGKANLWGVNSRVILSEKQYNNENGRFDRRIKNRIRMVLNLPICRND